MRNDPPAPETIVPELLSCGERTLWRWSRCGIAPARIKLGNGKQGAVRFRRAELEKSIAAGCPRVDGRAAQ